MDEIYINEINMRGNREDNDRRRDDRGRDDNRRKLLHQLRY